MSEPAQTVEGWYALHDFRTINWPMWKSASEVERTKALAEFREFSAANRELAHKGEGSYGTYTVSGHKADLLLLGFRPRVEDLIAFKTAFQKTAFANYTHEPYSYTSIVELSGYLGGKPVSIDDPHVSARLKPQLNKGSYICFYPMNKRRQGSDNWYMLDMDTRAEMMASHGMIGRSYAGKVTQIVTGSIGFDDWEWGVTLFANDPLQFKKLVYEMRFDEVSARFAEFGPFYVGVEAGDDDLAKWLTV